jgi:integrative and conjugative element protein (TIGR02256 family)
LEQEEINTVHSEGLHFIGDWHTHPESIPRASLSDVRSIRRAFEQSKHHLNGFVLLIAGTESFPLGLFLSLYDSHGETAILLDRQKDS